MAALAAIPIVGKAIDYIKKWKQPTNDMRKEIELLKQGQAAQSRMLDRDNKRINSMESALNLNLKAQMQLLQHGIHGNHKAAMQETYDEIQEYLINR